MKSTKFTSYVAAGLAAVSSIVALASVGVSTANAAAPISFALVTYQQSSTTNAGVVTYTSTPKYINTATVLTKVATTLAITLPAGAQLAVATANGYNSITFTYDYYAGDVVIVNPAGTVLYNLSNGISTTNGYVEIYFDNYNDSVSQANHASKSTSYSVKDLGELYLDFETSTVTDYIDIYDASFITGYTWSSYTGATGSSTISGGGEYYHYDSTAGNVYQPINGSSVVSAANAAVQTLFGRNGG